MVDKLKFVIAPDFAPQRIPFLELFSTLLSKHANCSVDLFKPMTPGEAEEAIKQEPHLVYCNPFMALDLHEQHGYIPVLRPVGKYATDDVVIFTGAESSMNSPADIKQGMKATCPGNLGVKTVAMYMDKKLGLNLNFETSENLQQAIQKVLRGEADFGLYLHQTFDSLSNLAKKQLKVLDQTDLTAEGYPDIRRVLLMKADADTVATTQKVIIGFKGMPEAEEMLEKLGVSEGFEAITPEMAGSTIANIKKVRELAGL